MIHIIGAGPTGMSLAWEILRSSDNEVTIYDRKSSAGGSWWEPEIENRDLHSHRIVFDRSFVNTQLLFSEMGIKWNDIFKYVEKSSLLKFAIQSFSVKDYGTLISLSSRVLSNPEKYMNVSLKEAIGDLSKDGQKYIEHLPLIMDGVTWDVMTSYEFVKNVDYNILSHMYTQKVSGKVMCDAMEKALVEAGANFIFDTELKSVQYEEDNFVATFSDGKIIDDGMLFLCLDNKPAINFLGDNWGPDAKTKVKMGTYECINVLIDYKEKPPYIKTDLEIATETKWKLQPKLLFGTNTISCVICDLSEEVLSSNPDTIKQEVIKQLGLPEPVMTRIAWGSEWDSLSKKWSFYQSSGVLGLNGQLPFFGKSSKVAMCGMMSPRKTPFSSIEASIEVSKSLSSELFGTRKPLKPLLLTRVLLLFTIILLIIVSIKIHKKTFENTV